MPPPSLQVSFILMNSFSTSADTRAFLAKEHGELLQEEDSELIQNKSPKIDAATLEPATYPETSEQEWCAAPPPWQLCTGPKPCHRHALNFRSRGAAPQVRHRSIAAVSAPVMESLDCGLAPVSTALSVTSCPHTPATGCLTPHFPRMRAQVPTRFTNDWFLNDWF